MRCFFCLPFTVLCIVCKGIYVTNPNAFKISFAISALPYVILKTYHKDVLYGAYSTDTPVCEPLASGRAAAVRPQQIGCSHLHISISGNVFMISIRSMPEVSVHH